MTESTFDPYERSADAIQEPPQTFWEILKQTGPGLILAASIVGTGELIATTFLGKAAGFALLWLVLVSCFIKVFVQLELGRYVLASGKTTLASFHEVPKAGRGLNWWWFIMMLLTQAQIGAMIGGTSYVLAMAFQGYGLGTELKPHETTLWALLITIVTSALLVVGSYRLVERFTTGLVVLFTFTTVCCVILLQQTPQAITASQIGEGLRFTIPTAAVMSALAMVGITGVGASELVSYPYWCLEKGYARHVGPLDSSSDWERRAKGWMRVMRVDAWMSMIVYTIATVAFYLLGAAVLHGMGDVEDSIERMIKELAHMYSPVLGPQSAKYFILVGVFVVLYSTLFAATAANSRITADFLRVNRYVDMTDHGDRQKWVRIFSVAFPVLGLILFRFIGKPKLMVTIGGISQALTLPMLAGVAIYLHYWRTDARLKASRTWVILLWISLAAFTIAASFGVWSNVK